VAEWKAHCVWEGDKGVQHLQKGRESKGRSAGLPFIGDKVHKLWGANRRLEVGRDGGN